MFRWFGVVNFSPYTKVAEFAEHLRQGRLMGSRCLRCGATSFPPRADCAACLGGEFEFVRFTGRARLHTYTKIAAAPTGFDTLAPYIVGVVDLEEGGRLLAWIGESIPESEIAIGMDLQVVPRLHEEREEIKVDYTLERPPTAVARS